MTFFHNFSSTFMNTAKHKDQPLELRYITLTKFYLQYPVIDHLQFCHCLAETVCGHTISVCEGAVAIEGGVLNLERVAITAGNQLHNVAILEGILLK